MLDYNFGITEKQKQFIDAEAGEVLFGGAAGGGKSYGQLIDGMLYAMKFPKSKQLVLRRTYPELEKSLIRVSLELFPREIYRYNFANHTGTFVNGSLLDFGYCDSENDVYRYQSAEYDVIRFDELTHFTEQMYTYLLSRLRGANNYPKSMRSSTNPGGIGHYWVKRRFIDIGEPNKVHRTENGTRLFIPAGIHDNGFLLTADPDYERRLKNLSEKDRRALLYGDWDIFDGQFFNEFSRKRHVVSPFPVPKEWRRYLSIDYGLDMLAALWIAVDGAGNAYVYRELYKSNLIVSEAAKEILRIESGDTPDDRLAPPDLWNRHSDSGESTIELFRKQGLFFRQSSNRREQGWLEVKEWLHPRLDEFGRNVPKLRIFSNCLNLIRTLPALTFSERNPNDTADEPHEITHAPDALRGFCMARPYSNPAPIEPDEDELLYEDQMENLLDYGF